MTGLGELIEGLYFLNLNPQAHQPVIASSQASFSTTFLPQETLWHFRLGHLSNDRLLSMQQFFPCIKVDNNSVCDICHYSRHKKLPFKLSVNKASHCYELIHFDIWGPVSISSIHGHKYFITALDDYKIGRAHV